VAFPHGFAKGIEVVEQDGGIARRENQPFVC